MSNKSYTVLSPIKHGGKVCKSGGVMLPESIGDALVASGHLENAAAAEEKAAADAAKAEKVAAKQEAVAAAKAKKAGSKGK